MPLPLTKQNIIDDVGSKRLYRDTDFRFDLLRNEAQDRIKVFIRYHNLCKSRIILSSSGDIGKDFRDIFQFLSKSEAQTCYGLAKNLLFANIYADCMQKNVKLTIDANSDWLERIDVNFITKTIDDIHWTLNYHKAIVMVLENKSTKKYTDLGLDEKQIELINRITTFLNSEEELTKKEKQIYSDKDVLNATQNKVLSQLKFIDTLLSNPREIDRIEDYESTFSRINYENLKKIAQILINDNR